MVLSSSSPWGQSTKPSWLSFTVHNSATRSANTVQGTLGHFCLPFPLNHTDHWLHFTGLTGSHTRLTHTLVCSLAFLRNTCYHYPTHQHRDVHEYQGPYGSVRTQQVEQPQAFLPELTVSSSSHLQCFFIKEGPDVSGWEVWFNKDGVGLPPLKSIVLNTWPFPHPLC